MGGEAGSVVISMLEKWGAVLVTVLWAMVVKEMIKRYLRVKDDLSGSGG